LHTVTFATPQVVVTLKPIHALVAGVMEGVGAPTLLLPDGASPHTFQLKPSTLQQLHGADLIIWVGPSLETFMQKLLADLHPRWGRISLLTIPSLTTLPVRHTREWAHDPHAHSHSHEAHDNVDPHIWLSTTNAQIIVSYIARYLSAHDPQHAKEYERNEKALLFALRTLHNELNTLLAPVRTVPFLVYHDGYQYFEKEFQLNAVGTLLINPHVPLSAHGLQTISQLIQSRNVRCVFRETEFNDTLVKNNLAKWHVKSAVLDPLGATFVANTQAYQKLMTHLGETLQDCLKNG